jgi:hypothetical protein
MENVIQTTITCTITWELPFMLEGFRLIIYTCFTSLRFDTLNIISFPFSFMIDILNWLLFLTEFRQILAILTQPFHLSLHKYSAYTIKSFKVKEILKQVVQIKILTFS